METKLSRLLYLGRKVAGPVDGNHEDGLVHSVFDGEVEHAYVGPVFVALHGLIAHRLALLIPAVRVRILVQRLRI